MRAGGHPQGVPLQGTGYWQVGVIGTVLGVFVGVGIESGSGAGRGARGTAGNCGERRGEAGRGEGGAVQLLQSGRGRGLLCSRRDGRGLPLVVDDVVAGVYGEDVGIGEGGWG